MFKAVQKLVINTFYAPSAPVYKKVPGSQGLVLVLGWGGSKPNNFGKILHHYESKGLSTVLHIMPLFCPKFVRNGFEADVENMVNKHIDQQDLFVHMHSQNSIWTFSALLKRGELPIPDKVIIDSAPALRYRRNPSEEADSLAQLATSLVTGKALYYKFPFTPIVRALLYIHMNISALTDRVLPQKFWFVTNYMEMHRYLRDHYPIVPTLFLYSSGDRLIPAHSVQAFRDCIKARGVPVSEYMFGEDVSHITAVYKQPKKYLQLVDDFLELNSKKS